MAFLVGQREITLAGQVVPTVTTLVLALTSVVPLHIPGFDVVTPAFALMAVFHWTVYRPDLLPLGVVFALGLLLDLLNGTPAGVSSLVLLVVRSVLLERRGLFVDKSFAVVWGGFLVFAAAAFALEWLTISLLHRMLLGIRPILFQSVLTIACFPVGSYLLASVHRAVLVRN
jgi:rod shape-determining protein MreD